MRGDNNVKVPFTLPELNYPCEIFLAFAWSPFRDLQGVKPCFTLQEQPIKNFSAHWVFELKKSKFFERKGKSAVNSYSINEHFNALLRKICLFKPYAVRISYADNLLSFLALSIRDSIFSCRHRAAEWRLL